MIVFTDDFFATVLYYIGGGGGEAERSEGRLRAEMKGGGGQPLVQEGRLRAGQPSQVDGSQQLVQKKGLRPVSLMKYMEVSS